MANICSNTLTISCDKKHKKELQQFKTLALARGIIKKKDLEAKKDEWLSTQKEQYKKENRFADWIKQSDMPAEKFFVEILFCTKEKNGNINMGNSYLSMQNILPCPIELLGVTSPVRAENGENEQQFKDRVARHKRIYGHEDWYSWKTAKWGCKWDINADLTFSTETSVQYMFDSPWTPPTAFIETASEKFPNLKFELEYDEPGCCFRGTAYAEGGDTTDTSENYEPTCNDCGGEFDEKGECPCEREHRENKEKQFKKTKSSVKNK
ncbi:MAG: hypothetical protein Q8O88_03735 [bacterium]|nr:hypothetical protein [bacterium]